MRDTARRPTTRDTARRLARGGALLLCLAWNASAARAENPCALDAPEILHAQAGENSGMGGSGLTGESGMGGSSFTGEGGMGGSGFTGESGMGGSGFGDEGSGMGGSGLLGTITGFASVCVNGLEVHTPADTPVTRWGRATDLSQLAVGQAVWIEATARDGSFEAVHIDVLTAAAGTVTALDAANRRIRIDSRWIDVTPGASLFDMRSDAAVGFEAFEPGAFAVVSGLPTSQGRIVASRIVRTTPESGAKADLVPLATLLEQSPKVRFVWVEGHMTQLQDNDRFRIADTEMRLTRPTDTLSTLAVDTRVLVRGSVDATGDIAVDDVRVAPQPSAPVRPVRPGVIEPDDGARLAPDTDASGALAAGATSTAPADAVPSRRSGKQPRTANPSKPEPQAQDRETPAIPQIPQRPEQPEKPDRPPSLVRPEPPIRPERPVRPERPQRPERPDVADRPQSFDIRP